MKRLFALLLLLALLPACACASAIFSHTDILREDGSRAVLRVERREGEIARWKNGYTLLETAANGETTARTFPGKPYLITKLDTGFAGGCMLADGRHQIVLYDDHAAPLLHVDVPLCDAYVQGYARSGGALYLLVRSWGISFDEDLTVLRIEDGHATFVLPYDESAYPLYAIHAEAQGGALLTGAHEEDYKRQRVMCIDAQGSVRWKKTLSAKNAVISPRLTVVNDDGTTTLYGSCIAASRDLYTAFAMQLDADGRVLSLDVRDLRVDGARINDTSPDFSFSWDGSVLVEMIARKNGEDTSAVVLFSDLPKAASVPAIVLQ